MGACAVTLWGAQGKAPETFAFVTPEMPNAFLFIACGMIWSGARLFHGRAVLPGALFAGAVAWFLAMQFDGFAGSEQARVMLASFVIALYAYLTAFELRRERRRNLAALWASFAIPALHAVVFLSPIPADRVRHRLPERPVRAARFRDHDLCGRHRLRRRRDRQGARRADPQDRRDDRSAYRIVQPPRLSRSGQWTDRPARAQVAAGQPDDVRSRQVQIDQRPLRTRHRRRRAQGVRGHRIGKCPRDRRDRPARGEEFAAIIPGNADEAALVAERLRAAFQAAGVVISGHEIGATVSIGIADGGRRRSRSMRCWRGPTPRSIAPSTMAAIASSSTTATPRRHRSRMLIPCSAKCLPRRNRV